MKLKYKAGRNTQANENTYTSLVNEWHAERKLLF